MRGTRPALDAPQLSIAEHQEEFVPITGAFVKHPEYGLAPGHSYNCVVLAFRPTDEERAKIAAGEDIYLSLLTWGGPMQGVLLSAGPEDMGRIFNVPVRRLPDGPGDGDDA
jgi:hypothetical protein